MAPEDVSHLLNNDGGTEQQPTDPTNTEQAAPEVPEQPQFIRIGEREYAPSDLETRLRISEDYEKNFADLRKRERAAWEAEQRAQQIEAQWQQHLETRQQPQQPQRYPAPPADDDPIAMLRALNSEVLSIKQAQEEERQFFKDQLRQQWLSEQNERIGQAYENLNQQIDSESKRLGRKLPKFSYEELEMEAVNSGLAQGQRNSWEKVLEKAYRNLAWEHAMEAAAQSEVERLRHPKATITVPGGRGGSAPAPAAPSDNGLGNMTFGEAREFFPGR